jgi:hypothetical protein
MSNQRLPWEYSLLMRAIHVEDEAIALAAKVVPPEEVKPFAQQMLARMEKFQSRDGEIVDEMFKAQLASARQVKKSSDQL